MRQRPFPQYPTSYLTEVSGMNMKQKNAFCHTAPNFLEYSTLSHAPVVSVLYAVLSYVQGWPKELVMGCENFSNLCVVIGGTIGGVGRLHFFSPSLSTRKPAKNGLLAR